MSYQKVSSEDCGSKTCDLPLYTDELEKTPNANTEHVPNTPRCRRTRRVSHIIASVAAVVILFYLTITTTSFRPFRNCQMSKSLPSHHKYRPHTQQQLETTGGCNRTSTGSNALQGSFDLYDCLEISSTSGSIDIAITPKPGKETAKLRISSSSGSVNVRLHEDFLSTLKTSTQNDAKALSFSRAIDSEITSSSGSVDLAWIIGNGGATKVESRSGQVTLDLETVNIGPDDEITTLKTVTQSAQQTINIRPLLSSRGDDRITKLKSAHVVHGSGQMDLVYPKEWEGKLSATVLGHGSVRISGDGLVVDTAQSKLIEAHKGSGEGVVSLFEAGSGSLKFCLV